MNEYGQAGDCTCIQDESREWVNCPIHGEGRRAHLAANKKRPKEQYVVLLSARIPAGTIESPTPTVYYNSYEEAVAEGNRWLEYKPPSNMTKKEKRRSYDLSREWTMFTIKKYYVR